MCSYSEMMNVVALMIVVCMALRLATESFPVTTNGAILAPGLPQQVDDV